MKPLLSHGVLLLAILFAGRAIAVAGEPLSRRGNRPPPSERGQRLRQLGGRLLDTLDTIAADAGQAQSLDIAELNQEMLALVEPLLAQNRAIEYFRFGFDPQGTDFAADSVSAFIALGLTRTAWSPNPTHLDLKTTAHVLRAPGEPARARIEGEMVLDTEVIPLANRAMRRISDRLSKDPGFGSPGKAASPADVAFRAQVSEKLARTPPLESMDDLADLVIYIAGLRVTSISDEVERLKLAVAEAGDEAARQALSAELAIVRTTRDRLLYIRPSIERDDQGQVAAIRFCIDERADFDTAEVEQLDVNITGGRITLAAASDVIQGVDAYLLFKPLAVSMLTRIQKQEPAALQLGRGVLGDMLQRAQRELIDEEM